VTESIELCSYCQIRPSVRETVNCAIEREYETTVASILKSDMKRRGIVKIRTKVWDSESGVTEKGIVNDR